MNRSIDANNSVWDLKLIIKVIENNVLDFVRFFSDIGNRNDFHDMKLNIAMMLNCLKLH